jgi:hypothetical protein
VSEKLSVWLKAGHEENIKAMDVTPPVFHVIGFVAALVGSPLLNTEAPLNMDDMYAT